MGGICLERPLNLGFYAKSMRDVTAIFRAFLCWVENGDRKHSCELVFIRG